MPRFLQTAMCVALLSIASNAFAQKKGNVGDACGKIADCLPTLHCIDNACRGDDDDPWGGPNHEGTHDLVVAGIVTVAVATPLLILTAVALANTKHCESSPSTFCLDIGKDFLISMLGVALIFEGASILAFIGWGMQKSPPRVLLGPTGLVGTF